MPTDKKRVSREWFIDNAIENAMRIPRELAHGNCPRCGHHRSLVRTNVPKREYIDLENPNPFSYGRVLTVCQYCGRIVDDSGVGEDEYPAALSMEKER